MPPSKQNEGLGANDAAVPGTGMILDYFVRFTDYRDQDQEIFRFVDGLMVLHEVAFRYKRAHNMTRSEHEYS